MDDELLDLVDAYDTVIGTVNRKDYNDFLDRKQGYIRAVDMFIMNDKGELWIPVRTASKTIAPNGYDFGVGGHVGAGEDYLTALFREAEEEVGLHLTPEDVEFVGKVKATAIRYFRSIYLYRSNAAPTLNPADYVSAQWMTPARLLASVDEGHPAKGNIAATVILLQLYLGGKL